MSNPLQQTVDSTVINMVTYAVKNDRPNPNSNPEKIILLKW